jgi:site-specific DNA-methyltransferase (adenine-specific)
MKNLLLGDNLQLLKTLPDNSVDSVVTDPPYGLSFMGKKWDYDVPSIDLWREVYRVLKPGGHLLSFGGTRTYHRMVVNIEDAGFEIRDQIMWLYGSGFPKSLNIGKAIDKVEGNEREVVGDNPNSRPNCDGLQSNSMNGKWISNKVSKGNSEGEGWGTGLKPANEPIVVARKPISENTIAENFIKWGVGGFNIDECRIGETTKTNSNGKNPMYGGNSLNESKTKNEDNLEHNYGRFPANIILECICDEVIKGDIHTNPECPCRLLDDQSGNSKSTKFDCNLPNLSNNIFNGGNNGNGVSNIKTDRGYSDNGGASRFFYVAKTSKAERNMGLDNFEDKDSKKILFPEKEFIGNDGSIRSNKHNTIKNNHPTIKPINLMYYLCKLVTPNGGVILDPYMGSGSTGISALLGGFSFIGMEMEQDYFNIAETRINQYEEYRKFLKK